MDVRGSDTFVDSFDGSFGGYLGILAKKDDN